MRSITPKHDRELLEKLISETSDRIDIAADEMEDMTITDLHMNIAAEMITYLILRLDLDGREINDVDPHVSRILRAAKMKAAKFLASEKLDEIVISHKD